MATKKVKELREMSDKELQKLRSESEKRLMEIRFKAKIEKPKNPMEKRELKRTIARINSLLQEMQANTSKS